MSVVVASGFRLVRLDVSESKTKNGPELRRESVLFGSIGSAATPLIDWVHEAHPTWQQRLPTPIFVPLAAVPTALTEQEELQLRHHISPTLVSILPHAALQECIHYSDSYMKHVVHAGTRSLRTFYPAKAQTHINLRRRVGLLFGDTSLRSTTASLSSIICPSPSHQPTPLHHLRRCVATMSTMTASTSGTSTTSSASTSGQSPSSCQPPTLRLASARIALVQLGQTSHDKSFNIEHARKAVTKAAKDDGGADIVVLPECWNSPYGVQYFNDYAENFGGIWERVKKPIDRRGSRMRGQELTQDEELLKRWCVDGLGGAALDISAEDCPSETIIFMSKLARELGVVLVGGSIPERSAKDGRLFNTATVFDQKGRLIAIHRKVRRPEVL